MDFGKLNFSTSFNPTSAFPLDAREYFDSLDKAKLAAQSAKEVGSTESTYYIGQTLVVVEDDQSVLYVIQPDLSLKRVGTESTQSDMSQTDASHPGYVKNKTHYDSRRSAQFSALENPNPESFELFNGRWYKMCDLTPTIGEILRAKWNLNGLDVTFEPEHIRLYVYNKKDELVGVYVTDDSFDIIVVYQACEVPVSFMGLTDTISPQSTGIFRGMSSFNDQTFSIEYGELKKLEDKYLPGDILREESLGQPSGIATLDETGKVPESQLPAPEELTIDEAPTEGSDNPISSGGVYQALNDLPKPKEYQFDEAPTEGSDNLLTSGAVHKAISELDIDVEFNPEFDNAPTKDSDKLLTSGVIHQALSDMQSSVNDALKDKANQSEVDKSLEDIGKAIDSKAEKSVVEQFQGALADKADKSAIENLQKSIDGKVEKSVVEQLQEDLLGKADASVLTGIQQTLGGKADQSEVDKKVDKDKVYSKEEIDGKLSGIYHYKGSLENYADLPTEDVQVGDAYNIQTADADKGIKAGDNVAWTGTEWDILSGIVDLSAYAKASDLEKKVDQTTLEKALEDKVTTSALEEALKDKITEDDLEKSLEDKVTQSVLEEALKDKVTEDGLNEVLKDKVDKESLGKAGGVAILDDTGKIPNSLLPASHSTSTYETIIIYTIFDTENNVYRVDEESAVLLRAYEGEKTMFLYEPLGQLYIPYVGNYEFVIDVFGASIYFRVDLDTLICEVSIGEWVSLNEEGEISEDKIPSIIVHGYYNPSEDLFYEEKTHETLIIGNYKKFFVDLRTDTLYSYSKGKYYPITTVAGSGSAKIEYLPDNEYEELLAELGI